MVEFSVEAYHRATLLHDPQKINTIVCACVCVCVRVRACVRACVRASVRQVVTSTVHRTKLEHHSSQITDASGDQRQLSQVVIKLLLADNDTGLHRVRHVSYFTLIRRFSYSFLGNGLANSFRTLTRFAIQAKGPDGKWTRKPLAYRESNNVHLLITRPPEICVNLVFKHIHAASSYTICRQFVPFIYCPL